MDQATPPTLGAPGDIPGLSGRPVERWMRPVVRFMHIEAASGMILLGCAVLALIAANSPLAPAYHALWEFPIGIQVGSFSMLHPLHHWVNDGLMTIFFFVVGLELKREFVAGEMRDPRKAALPLAAALGGMLVPAAFYLALQLGQPGERGWGIPMATDIAFVVGVMALLGSRVPHGLRIMMLTLAIIDDIGAVVVIALAYSQDVSGAALAAAAIGFGLCFFLGRIGVRAIAVYVVVALGIWLAVVDSGVHPTVAGVLLGLMTPITAPVAGGSLRRVLSDVVRHLEDSGPTQLPDPHLALGRQTIVATRESLSPLGRLETMLHPWVAFGIMPLFALANAGVHIEVSELGHPVGVAVAAGLVLGKPIGVVLMSWIFVRIGLARLPDAVGWPSIVAGGFLAGIGFTMALFIAGLALEGDLLNASKIGILGGSTIAGIVGLLLLHLTLPRSSAGAVASPPPPTAEEHT